MKTDISQFTSLLTWWWLPSFGSNLVLNFLYSSSILSPPTSPRARANHLQLTRTAVIIATLLYQLYTAVSTAPPSYYRLLNVPLDVDADTVKRSFRALARKFHPDKVDGGEQGEQLFILLRRAHDALSDPLKQAAYDRFGPSILDCKECESPRDYIRRGLLQRVAFYTVNPALYALVGYVQRSSNAFSFWRLASLFALFAWEVRMLISPNRPQWIQVLLPTTTIHDLLALVHGVFVNFFFASLQLVAALDVLEYGEHAAPARDRASKVHLIEMQMDAVRRKAMVVDGMAEVVSRNVVGGLAVSMRPYSASKAEGGMTEEGESLWAKVDEVLLARTILQQNPALAAVVAKVDVKQAAKLQGEDERATCQDVKIKQEHEEEALISPTEEVAVKTEQVKPVLQPAAAANHAAPKLTVKQEVLDSSATIPSTTASSTAVELSSTGSQPEAPTTTGEGQVQETASTDSTVAISNQEAPVPVATHQQPTEAPSILAHTAAQPEQVSEPTTSST